MTTMTIKGPATLQDLLNTPKDGNKYELVDGEIVVSPAGMRHSEVAINIGGLIWEFLQKNPIGKLYASDVGIAFPNGNVTYGRLMSRMSVSPSCQKAVHRKHSVKSYRIWRWRCYLRVTA